MKLHIVVWPLIAPGHFFQIWATLSWYRLSLNIIKVCFRRLVTRFCHHHLELFLCRFPQLCTWAHCLWFMDYVAGGQYTEILWRTQSLEVCRCSSEQWITYFNATLELGPLGFLGIFRKEDLRGFRFWGYLLRRVGGWTGRDVNPGIRLGHRLGHQWWVDRRLQAGHLIQTQVQWVAFVKRLRLMANWLSR